MAEGLAWPPRKEDLERLYLVEKLSAAKIAKVYGLKYKNDKVAESTVLYQLRKNGIQRRDPAEHIRRVTDAMADEWARRYQAGESLRKIAAGNINSVTVWNHLKARGLVLRDKVEAQILAVTKYERKPFRGDDVDKAYLLGLRYGDLDAARHGRGVRVRVSTTHPAMAQLFESLFSPYGQVHRYPREAKFSGYEWTLECDLDNSFGFLLRKPTIKELRQFNSKKFNAFLAGFFDAEGTIYLHRKRHGSMFEVSISNTDITLLDLIEQTLRRHGYHPRRENRIQGESRLGYLKYGEISVLHISMQHEVCQLLSQIRPRHSEKAAKAGFVVQRICGDLFGVGQDEVEDWEDLGKQIKRDRDAFVNLAKENLPKKGDRF